MKTTLIRSIGTLTGILDSSEPLRGTQLAQLNEINNAYLLLNDGVIVSFGKNENAPERADEIIDAEQNIVMPAWCDSHTHIVFAKNRASEFVQKIQGWSYEKIAASGGGILNSAKSLAATEESELLESALERIEEIKGTGTASVEIKSGYGLSVESEIKMLRVIKRLKGMTDITVKATFLGAHAYPTQYKENHEGYIKEIVTEMLPVIADEGLADYIDVFCEKGYFSIDEAAQILEAGLKAGLHPKIHVNQFNALGGVDLAIKFNALSVDHLEITTDADVNLLSNSNTIATLLPGCSHFLKIPYANASQMIRQGVAVALASDYNPGSCPSGNMNLVVSLACTNLGMLPEEAINAATVNGAAAMGLGQSHGRIAVGLKPGIIITKKMESIAEIPYYFGANKVERLIV